MSTATIEHHRFVQFSTGKVQLDHERREGNPLK